MKNKFKSTFIKNVLSLMSGQAIAQMITVGITPVTTRLFTPENFGLFALFTAGTSIISSISSLCYERAIILPQKKNDAIHLIFLSLIILVATVLLTFLIFILLRNQIAGLLGNLEFSLWVLFIPVSVLIVGLGKIFRIWRLRERQFASIAFSRGWESVVSAIFKIVTGFLIGSISGGLIGGAIFGSLAATITLILRPERFIFKKRFSELSNEKTKEVARRYKNFPYFASWNALLNFFSQNFFIFIFSAFFTPVVAGFYSLGSRALQQPISLFSQSIQNAYLQKTAHQLATQRKIIPGLKKTIFSLFCIGVIPFTILTIFGKDIFATIFGVKWVNSGIYIQIMAPWFLLIFIGSPAKVIYEVCQKQHVKLVLNILIAVFRIAAIFIGYYLSKDPIVVLISFVVVNVIFEMAYTIAALYLAYKVDEAII